MNLKSKKVFFVLILCSIISFLILNHFYFKPISFKGFFYKNVIGNYYDDFDLSDKIFNQEGKFKLPHKDWLDGKTKFRIFGDSLNDTDDKVWSQLRYSPKHARNIINSSNYKVILLYNGINYEVWESKNMSICPVQSCRLTADKSLANTADMIIWIHKFSKPSHKRPPHQIWVMRYLESPHHISAFPSAQEIPIDYRINWTATYRRDSTVPLPYGIFIPLDLTKEIPKRYPQPIKNYAKGKTKMVVGFISNCGGGNSRMQFIAELNNYLVIDIYGICGKKKCASSDRNVCIKEVTESYKFYLAFENSNCRHYITEKFFENALLNNVLPIVRGAHPDDYKYAAPPHSYIHVDDFATTKDLADYLKYLDKNETAYNEYFAWKGYYTHIRFPYIWCRLCAMLYIPNKPLSIYNDLRTWNNGDDKNKICIGSNRWTSY